MNLNCIIIDDEPNAVNLLEILIHRPPNGSSWQNVTMRWKLLHF